MLLGLYLIKVFSLTVHPIEVSRYKQCIGCAIIVLMLFDTNLCKLLYDLQRLVVPVFQPNVRWNKRKPTIHRVYQLTKESANYVTILIKIRRSQKHVVFHPYQKLTAARNCYVICNSFYSFGTSYIITILWTNTNGIFFLCYSFRRFLHDRWQLPADYTYQCYTY